MKKISKVINNFCCKIKNFFNKILFKDKSTEQPVIQKSYNKVELNEKQISKPEQIVNVKNNSNESSWSTNKEVKNFEQVKHAYEKVQKILDKSGTEVYISGGSVPYLLLNQDSNRFHSDIDSVCKIEDMKKLRKLFKSAGLYIPEWDSVNYAKDGKDYGFEMKIDGIPFGIYPFSYQNGMLVQHSYDPYNHQCKIKKMPVKELSDYVCSYTGVDGKKYDTMSLEYIKLSKDAAHRDKDIKDSAKISEIGIRQKVFDRLIMPRETQKIKAEKLSNSGNISSHLTDNAAR